MEGRKLSDGFNVALSPAIASNNLRSTASQEQPAIENVYHGTFPPTPGSSELSQDVQSGSSYKSHDGVQAQQADVLATAAQQPQPWLQEQEDRVTEPASKRQRIDSDHLVNIRTQPNCSQDGSAARTSSISSNANPAAIETGSTPATAHSPAESSLGGNARSSSRAKSKHQVEVRIPIITADVSTGPVSKSRNRQRALRVTKPREPTRTGGNRQVQEAAAEIVADAVQGTSTRGKGRRGRKRREPTPEEAETSTITPSKIKMADLCKDNRMGKKSLTEIALQQRDKEAFIRRKEQDLQELVRTGATPDSGEPGSSGNAPEVNNGPRQTVQAQTQRQEDVLQNVPDTVIDEDGNIIIDVSTTQIDRHAQAAAGRDRDQLVSVEEDDLSRRVNSASFSKREKPNSWPEELTDEFYEGLRMFGTDFSMISKMLGKTRHAVKLKFCREEKLDGGRIKEALLGERIAVDMEDYSRRAGENIAETHEHERLMEEDRKLIKESAADELRAKEEQEQLRREEAERERAASADRSSGKENRESRGHKKRKNKKQRVSKDPKGRGRKKRKEDLHQNAEEVSAG